MDAIRYEPFYSTVADSNGAYTLEVTDGGLTVEIGNAGGNTMLDQIVVTPAGPSPEPSGGHASGAAVTGDRGRGRVGL